VTITHHLDDATLLSFAAGTLGEAHSILAASHISVCKQCRENFNTAESVGGEILNAQETAAVSDLCRSATLASLDQLPKAQAKTKFATHDLPPAIARIVGSGGLANIKWSKKAPGIAVYDVPMAKGDKTHLKFLRIGKGKAMPEHGHGGEEITFILKGSYNDHTGRYVAGDVADLDEDIEHQPIVDSDEDCICIIATEAPTKFKSLWARLAQPFVGI
jgi:putative transcriptional regulator